jgi:hypothetical protein
MTAAEYTFDITPARRPSLADVGGASKTDDAEFPPNPETDPTAPEWNFFAQAVARYGGLNAVCVFEVTFFAGAPTITAFAALRTSLEAASVTPTDNGVGDTTFAFPSGVLPPRVVRGHAWVTEDGEWFQPVVLHPSSTTIRVKTRASGVGLADANFVVALF